ncbi:MAG: MazG family protein [Chloroflexi bacterium]|nr:MazG family protein [Chloroflexota bacterium]MYK60508.1 MazG family protein [Chloroflexota bacterium]
MNQPIPSAKNDQIGFQFLVDTVRTLRDPGGCPWDAEQTHQSLRPNLLEEAYEMLEAIENADPHALEEELGDVMIQIVFHADIARRNGDFDADSVCRKVAEKLIRRHPHVFGDDDKLDSGEDVVDRWERIKRQEAGGIRSIVASVPKALPALAQSAVLQRRTIRAGLPVGNNADTTPIFLERKPEESDDQLELRAGQFLAAAVRAVQDLGVDAETALQKVNSALRNRVLRAEELVKGTALAELDDQARDRIWELAS